MLVRYATLTLPIRMARRCMRSIELISRHRLDERLLTILLTWPPLGSNTLCLYRKTTMGLTYVTPSAISIRKSEPSSQLFGENNGHSPYRPAFDGSLNRTFLYSWGEPESINLVICSSALRLEQNCDVPRITPLSTVDDWTVSII